MVKINMSEAVLEKKWDKASVSYGESWLRAFQRFSLNHALVGNHSVPDLGGDGSFVLSASRNDNLSVRSVDLHNSNADIKADLSNSLWAEHDFGAVDIVVSNNLVDHLPNPHEFLR
jgi:2-polyprenyl-3-methyl-5-hydroxy-6-metoxy-1,4-benzoquinol methylase